MYQFYSIKAILFALAFTFFHLSFSQEEKIVVQNGNANLSAIDLQEKTISLEGDWEFHWQKLLHPEDFVDTSYSKQYYPVPAFWNEENDKKRLGVSKFGYGTYRLIVNLGENKTEVGIKVRSKGLPYNIFVNGNLMGQSGSVGTSPETCIPESTVDIVSFEAPSGVAEIIIQFSNFHNRRGGLSADVLIGNIKTLRESRRKMEMMDLFLAGAIFIMGIYHFGLFLVRKKALSPLFFALFCLVISLRIIMNENFGTDIMEIDGFIHRKIDYLTFYLAFGIFFFYSSRLFLKDVSRLIVKVALIIVAIYSLGVIFLPMKWYTPALGSFYIITFLGMFYYTYIMIMATIKKREGAKSYLTGWILFFVALTNDLLHYGGIIETTPLNHIGLFLFILTQAFLMMTRYERFFKRNRLLAKKLNYANKTLEQRVEKRTRDLEQKNKSITESITYAKKIQTALLPLGSEVKKVFPDSFIFLKPKLQVGGDFYWFNQIDTERGKASIIVGADCTVQGVSGALLTVSGSAFLDQIVTGQKEHNPDQIAAKLNNSIRNLLHQTQNKDSVMEGINAAICVIYHEEKSLEYVGANMPLIYMKRGEVEKIDPTSISLGGNLMQVDNSIFEKHKLWLNDKEISFYLYSNGYTNQIGGPSEEAFGISRLLDLVSKLSNKTLADQLLEFEMTIENWMIEGENKQQDDMLVMGFDLSSF